MTLITKNLLACRKKVRTTQPITTKHSSCFSGNGHYLVSFWRNSVRNPLFGKNSSKNSNVFFHGQHSIGHKVWVGFTYPFLTLNGCTVEV